MKYPVLIYTTLLSAFLLAPFAIRTLAPTLEPYPAVLLPTGGGTIKITGGQIDLGRLAIYGKNAGSEAWTRLSPSRFLSPIPPQYFPNLAQRNFGMTPGGPIAHRIHGVGVVVTIQPRQVSEAEVRNTKQWLRARLKGCGCDDNLLRMTQDVVTLRPADGAEIAVRYQDDKVLDLH
jgi:hypothetical protein